MEEFDDSGLPETMTEPDGPSHPALAATLLMVGVALLVVALAVAETLT